MKQKRKYLEYKDYAITIFNDDDKLMLVFVNDRGNAKVVSYDDNMFYIEYLLDTYLEMIENDFLGWRNKHLTDKDYEEIQPLLKRYYRHVKRYGDIDLEALNGHTREVLGL